MFCEILGASAGDAVLCTGALGGVKLAGGILPNIKPLLMKSAFIERFLNKGRMQDFVAPVPIDLIMRDDTALIGAAAYGRIAKLE